MAIYFQFNKTYLNQLNKALKVRENALPTLIAKESALRNEVRKARLEVAEIESEIQKKSDLVSVNDRLWTEFPAGLLKTEAIGIDTKKIAGVSIPVFKNISFAIGDYSLFVSSAWIPAGIEIIKEYTQLKVRFQISKRKVEILEFARKKTTQKVNLYEKVQIPEYREAIRKIKRFIEDEENLSKSSQKILKAKLAVPEGSPE